MSLGGLSQNGCHRVVFSQIVGSVKVWVLLECVISAYFLLEIIVEQFLLEGILPTVSSLRVRCLRELVISEWIFRVGS